MVHIGVLIVSPIQLLDIAPVDLFAMLTKEYFNDCKLPQPLVDVALSDSDFTISYIGHSGAGTVANTTARLGLSINTSLDDPAVAPGKLDILVIPGPPPGMKPEEEVLDFVRKHVDSGGDLLTICTGIFVAAYASVLDGRNATGSRGIEDWLERDFPKVKWQDKRYVNDGKIWTSGGITNGMDMVAVYMRQRWPGALSDTVLTMADVVIRPQEYDTGKLGTNAWWVLHIFKAWLRGLTKTKTID
ncbi:ThiJ/PfpI family protein [Massariosphaeria phaeospora]|uniref:ThiJ/PfpI family protein n=1 Tax=Massariosphaeria phaeospora TaxID=100035 RepID=A0A7C8M7U9_9PLEO|nr:ThiJ/PfpI family protein [Massariosphaeria phaeospora]